MKTNRHSTVLCWAAGLSVSLVLCVLVFGFGRVQVGVNDDTAIIRALSGFSGTYPALLPHMHGLLLRALSWLHQQIPSIHWFSWMMIGSIYFSLAVVYKVLFQRGGQGKRLLALLMSVTSFILMWLMPAVEITFTNVSTLLGCAAMAQLLSLDPEKVTTRQMVLAVLLAFVLAALGYALRIENLYPILGFCGLAALFQLLCLHREKEGWQAEKIKRLLRCLAIPVIGMALLWGWRLWECSLPQNREVMDWTSARIVLTDYQGWGNLPDSLLSEIDLTPQDINVMEYWYFLDSDFDTATFKRIAEYQNQFLPKQSVWERLLKSQSDMWRCVVQEPYLLGGVVWIGLCFLLICASGQKKQRRFAEFSLLCWFVLMSYLAYRGRVIGRGLLAVIGPEATLLSVLVMIGLPFEKWRKWGGLSLLGLLVLLTVGGTALQAKAILTSEFDLMRAYRRQNLWSHLDYCAEQDPDTLYILDSQWDNRLFPDMKDGRVTNVMFLGGWPCRDSDVEDQLRRFGIDPEHMDGSLFLQDNVRLVSMDERIEKAMGEYIQSQVDEPVEAVEEYKLEMYNMYFKIIRYQLKQE